MWNKHSFFFAGGTESDYGKHRFFFAHRKENCAFYRIINSYYSHLGSLNYIANDADVEISDENWLIWGFITMEVMDLLIDWWFWGIKLQP